VAAYANIFLHTLMTELQKITKCQNIPNKKTTENGRHI
jgi:hypothetical protein